MIDIRLIFDTGCRILLLALVSVRQLIQERERGPHRLRHLMRGREVWEGAAHLGFETFSESPYLTPGRTHLAGDGRELVGSEHDERHDQDYEELRRIQEHDRSLRPPRQGH